MDVRSILHGSPLQSALGRPEVCVAVIDGPVDLSHPCFRGADLRRLTTLVQEAPGSGLMSMHGTHVTSLIFSQTDTGLTGIAPHCRGLILPVYSDSGGGKVPQFDLARAIEQAVEAGAHIINISGGERTDDGRADSMLERALRLCAENHVLVVAAVGNDGCDCLQAPAAIPSVLAVGATDRQGRPLPSNDWGLAYRTHAVLAPGEDITGAAPAGGQIALSGSSFATPSVAGLAALLVAQQLTDGAPVDPLAAGQAILQSARTPSCDPDDDPECQRHLAGYICPAQAYEAIERSNQQQDIPEPETTVLQGVTDTPIPAVPLLSGSVPLTSVSPSLLTKETDPMNDNAYSPDASTDQSKLTETAQPTEAATPVGPPHQAAVDQGQPAVLENAHPMLAEQPSHAVPPAAMSVSAPDSGQVVSNAAIAPAGDLLGEHSASTSGVQPACGGEGAAENCACKSANAPARAQYVYAIGTVGVDFGTEALRDSWRQAMPWKVDHDPSTGVTRQTQPNIYDAQQLHDYLSKNPWDSDKLIWTLNLDGGKPLYALVAETSAGMDWTETILPTSEYMTRDEVYKNSQDTAASADRLAALIETLSHPPVSRVYKILRDAYLGQSRLREENDFVSRVSVPGVLTDRTVRLFSGEMVHVLEVKARGLSTWNETLLVKAVSDAVKDDYKKRQKTLSDDQADHMSATVRALFDQLYYRFRNLGQTGSDRALNAAGTNAFLVAREVSDGILSAKHVPGAKDNFYVLDTISVEKSAYCRQSSSECYDVKVRFFDPENERRASVTYLFTYDVSTVYPVTLAPTRTFIERA